MPTLSIVIVNYNVKYFIRQCIQSILKSQFSSDFEIIVVDNNSSDESVQMLSAEFGDTIQLIANKENVGFSKANNQGFEIAQGKYVLILNPDTIVEENTLQTCYDYLENNSDTGAVGVRMFDGAGNYLPESKRGFPKPQSAFFKLSGLSKLFKNSGFFNQYYLGHLSNDRFHSIDVLTGAFMFVHKSTLLEVGGFDEDYFMYGEDIELSYQIKATGKKIMFLPTSSIIHFKGESTKKSSIDYLRNFYGAMAIYAGKRNKQSGFSWNVLLQIGILLTAIVAVFRRLTKKLLRPLLDVVILYGAANALKKLWGAFYFGDAAYYDDQNLQLATLILILLLVPIYAMFGQYDKRHNIKHLLYGFVFGSLAMLSVYSLFPLDLRFSRIVLLLIALLSPMLLYLSRKLYNKLIFNTWSFDALLGKRVAVVGQKTSCEKVSSIINMHAEKSNLVGFVSDDMKDSIGDQNEIKQIVATRDINELIFCSKDLSTKYIFNTISQLGNQISYKIANDDNTSILGSDSKDRVGEWYTLDIAFKIDQPFHKRTKRLIDIAFSIAFLILFPIVILLSKKRKLIYSNLFSVLVGLKTWVGYVSPDTQLNELPQIKSSVFGSRVSSESEIDNHSANLYYARKYSVWMEMEVVYKMVF